MDPSTNDGGLSVTNRTPEKVGKKKAATRARKAKSGRSPDLSPLGTLANAAHAFPATSVEALPESIPRMWELARLADAAIKAGEQGTTEEREMCRLARAMVDATTAALRDLRAPGWATPLRMAVLDYNEYVYGLMEKPKGGGKSPRRTA